MRYASRFFCGTVPVYEDFSFTLKLAKFVEFLPPCEEEEDVSSALSLNN